MFEDKYLKRIFRGSVLMLSTITLRFFGGYKESPSKYFAMFVLIEISFITIGFIISMTGLGVLLKETLKELIELLSYGKRTNNYNVGYLIDDDGMNLDSSCVVDKLTANMKHIKPFEKQYDVLVKQCLITERIYYALQRIGVNKGIILPDDITLKMAQTKFDICNNISKLLDNVKTWNITEENREEFASNYKERRLYICDVIKQNEYILSEYDEVIGDMINYIVTNDDGYMMK